MQNGEDKNVGLADLFPNTAPLIYLYIVVIVLEQFVCLFFFVGKKTF